MKETVLMGMSGSGKTTIIQALLGEAMAYAKTQTVQRHLRFIDTPGEYMEHRSFYRALIMSAVDAEEIGLVQDVGRSSWIPPAFATTFAKPVFGIVAKTDLATQPSDIEDARDVLLRAGADPIFEVSAFTGAGMAELWHYLDGDDVLTPVEPVETQSPVSTGSTSAARNSARVADPNGMTEVAA